MLNYTITLMNTYLKTIQCKKSNYFYEKDFNPITFMPRYFHGALTACNKRQSIVYNDSLFHINIRCIADKRIDEISSISIYSDEFNHENHIDIVQCINQLLIDFCPFISNDLYQALSINPTIKKLYHSLLNKLQCEHQRLRTNKPLDAYDIVMINTSKIHDVPYHIYLIMYVFEEKTINISLMFDLYNQL